MTQTMQQQPSVAYYTLTEPQLRYFVNESVKATLQEIGFNFDEAKARFTTDTKDEFKPLAYWLKKMNVNRSTIWRWQQEGLIKPTYMGKKLFFCQNDFDEMFKKKSNV